MIERMLLAAMLLLFGDTGFAGASPQPGDSPPTLTGTSPAGAAVELAALEGKVVVVTFWASWCPPCLKELPMLAKLQDVVGIHHLQVIAVNYKEDRRTFRRFLAANPSVRLTYLHDRSGAIANAYGVKTLPHMFIIDRDGRIAHVHRGYSEEVLASFIEEMMALLPREVLERPVAQ